MSDLYRLANRFTGAVLALVAVVFFVAMNLLTRLLADIPTGEKVFFRMITGVIIVAAMIVSGAARWEVNNRRLLLARGLLGAITVALLFYAIDHTSLARAIFLWFTYPAWGALFSWLFLKEPLGWRRVPAMILIYAGALLIFSAKPADGIETVSRGGDIAGLFCGVFSAAAVTTMRALHRHDSSSMIFFSFAVFGTLAGLALMSVRGGYVSPAPLEWVALAGIGVTATIAQLLYTTAFKYLDVAAVGAISMFQAPLSGLAAFMLLGERLAAPALAGGALVLAGGLYMAMASKAAKLEKPVVPVNGSA